MDPLVSHAQTLLGELTAVLEGVTVNTGKCWLLHLQAESIIHELQQLPSAAQASLGERAALVALHETLRAATAFCGEFKGRQVLQRMLTYKGDAKRFNELCHRFGEVAHEAGLALPLDEAAWREAQEGDIRAWDAMLAAVETGNVSTVDFGSVDDLTDQLAETSAIVVNLRQLQSKLTNNPAVSPASSGGTAFLHDMLAQQEAWEINPREVKFDQVEDEFGDMRRVSLGEGAFGEVLRGAYRGQAVAVKTIKFRLPSDHAEFLKEVNAMNKLHHPNIVVFLGAKVVDEQKGLIVLELLMCSLHRAVYFPAKHSVVWTEPLKREMTLQIAQGMAYLHTARPRITHGDMKPANVMLTDRNVCRIIDFGLSVVKESSRMASHDPRIMAGNGTLHYQAPELLKADTIAKRDHKVDVYAYAVTILELFQQQPPYPSAMSVREIETVVNRGQRPGVDHLLVPADIVALINVAWRQNKDQRPEFTAIVMGLLSFLQTGSGIHAAVAAVETATPSELVSDAAVDLHRERECEREAAEQAVLARETKKREKKQRLERAKQEKEAAQALQREQERLAAEKAAVTREVVQREERQKLEQAKLEREKQQKEAAEAAQRERERKAAEKAARVHEAAEREKQKKLKLEQKRKKVAEAEQRERMAAEQAVRDRETAEHEKREKQIKMERANFKREKQPNKAESIFTTMTLEGPEMSDDDVVQTIQAMQDNIAKTNIQCAGLSALAHFASVNTENKTKLAKLGGVMITIAAMRNHATNEHVQQNGCPVLAILALNDVSRVKIATLGGIEAVLAAMNAHRGNVGVQSGGCLALSNLATNQVANQIKIAAQGGIKAVVAALNAHQDDVLAQRLGCWALANLAINEANKVQIALLGGIEATGVAMNAHRSNADVQHYGCRVLANLAVNDANQVQIAALRGIEEVVAAMIAHRSNVDVQHFGCRVLANLAVNDANQVQIVALRGIEEVVAAMNAHRGNTNVQKQGCSGLATLARNGANKVQIAALGGIEVAVAAMNAHCTHADVQYYGCRVLANLAVNGDNVTKIAVLGGIEVIGAAMNAHRSNLDVQNNGLRALVNLANNDANEIQIAALGGIEVGVAAMNTHHANSSVQNHGCRMLAKLAVNADNAIKIAAGGGIEVVVAAMNAHRDNADMQHNGCLLLSNLAANNNANQLKIAQMGGIEVVLAAMKKYHSNANVQQSGCKALSAIAGKHKELQVKAETLGVIDVVTAAWKAFPSVFG